MLIVIAITGSILVIALISALRGIFKADWWSGWFTPYTNNLIQAVVSGDQAGPIVKYIVNVKDKTFDPKTCKLRPLLDPDPATGKREDPFKYESLFGWILRTQFGKAFIGIPLWPWKHQILITTIDRVVIKDSAELKKLEEDAAKNNQQVLVSDKLSARTISGRGIYGEIPRPMLLPSVDSGSGILIDLLMTAILEVVDPEPGLTIYKHNLLPTANGIIFSHINNIIKRGSWDNFKTNVGSSLDDSDLHIIQALLETIGLTITQLTFDDFGISKASAKAQDALQAKVIAENFAAAEIETARGKAAATELLAEADKKKRKLEGEGDRDAEKARAEGQAERVRILLTVYAVDGVDALTARRLAQEQVMNEDKYVQGIAKSQVRTLVGDSAKNTLLAIGEEK